MGRFGVWMQWPERLHGILWETLPLAEPKKDGLIYVGTDDD
jgi:hypothetical protein